MTVYAQRMNDNDCTINAAKGNHYASLSHARMKHVLILIIEID